jgi:nuclease S1
MRRLIAVCAIVGVVSSTSLTAWGGQGHRLVGLIAADRLTPVARQNVEWLLDGQSLAEVSSWADSLTSDQQQTALWHYLNIPPDAAGYDRDRDCPRQPDAAVGSRGDRWRDCAVDRIAYWEERLKDVSLDRADRATALKFIVHFIGDLHQPFHALGVGRGGNDVLVRVFGEANCGPSTSLRASDADTSRPCNLHAVWDSRLIAHRDIDDRAYLAALQQLIVERRWGSQPAGTPAQWAEQSWRLAREALVSPDTNIDEGYYRRHLGVIDERLALAGVRLAAVLNRALVTPPARR